MARSRLCAFCVLLWLNPIFTAAAATRYVWQESPSPAPPFTNWATAAHIIQDAVDAAAPGDTVLVTNGVYATGGTNDYRAYLDKPLNMLSVNGPDATVIVGDKQGILGCAYLTNGASLSGFTLTEGAQGVFGESDAAVLTNCVISSNAPYGGVYFCTVNQCTLIGNSNVDYGGGATFCALSNCTVTGNSTLDSGGAAWRSTLNNCSLSGNSASTYGGGTDDCTLNNCTLTGNSATQHGGGASQSTLNNCIVYHNTAENEPNASNSYFRNSCTTPLPTAGMGNISEDPRLASFSHLSADSPCIGAGSSAYTSGTDIDGQSWANPPSMGCDEFGVGTLNGSLSVGIAALYTNVATGFGLELAASIQGPASVNVWNFGDGMVASNYLHLRHAWALPGDYDVVLRAYNTGNPGGISATVTVHVVSPPVHYVAVNSANPVSPYTSWATAATTIQDAVDAAGSIPGAHVLVSNGVYTTGGRAIVGTMTNRAAVDKPLHLLSVNGPELTIIQGNRLLGTTNGNGAVRCVYLTTGASLSGFTLTNGATRNDGDGRERVGGGVLCESTAVTVSNCTLVGNSASSGGGAVYSGTLINCSLTASSAPYGGGASGSTLNHCSLVANSGGGAYHSTLNYCMVISNSGSGVRFQSIVNFCTLAGNSAFEGGGANMSTLNHCALIGNSAGQGGGAWSCTLTNCILLGNTATEWGGGALFGTLRNCTLAGNAATGAFSSGGGAAYARLTNCILYYNAADSPQDNYDSLSSIDFSCTTPMPTNGVGNITNAPLFVDTNGWSNLRLQSNSPCINAGNNAYATPSTDLDGRPRIVGGTVDMGAYEFQGPGFSEFIGWLAQHNLPTDGSADYTDTDMDGHNNWQEWKTWTIPTTALSVVNVLTAHPATNGILIPWQSVSGQNYFLERATTAGGSFSLLQSNLVGQATTTSYTDTNAAGLGTCLYRVGVPE